jgi:hypothetical protein
MLGAMDLPTALFEHLYARSLNALDNPGENRVRVARMLVHLLDEWPERWNERIERELAVWILEHLRHGEAVLALGDAFLGERSKLHSPRQVLRRFVERAHREGHEKVLVAFLESMGNLELLPADLDESIVRRAVHAGLRTEQHGAVACILSKWLRLHPEASAWIRPLLEHDPTLSLHESADPLLFLVAPTVAGALSWAELLDDAELSVLGDFRALGVSHEELRAVLRGALASNPRPDPRIILRCWLDDLDEQVRD